MKKESITVICVTPPDKIGEAKGSDQLQGLDLGGVVFNSLYTSNPKSLTNLASSSSIIILFLPRDAERTYKLNARALIRKLASSQNFYLFSDLPLAHSEMRSRFYTYNQATSPNTFFITIAKLAEKTRQLAA